jgi:hypothetical protein
MDSEISGKGNCNARFDYRSSNDRYREGDMAAEGTRTAAFASYGIDLVNVNWSLSGRSEDGKTVAVSIWESELIGPAGKRVYDRPNWGTWYSGPGRRYLFEDFAWARDHCEGIVRIVLATRRESAQDRVEAAESNADHDLIMRVTHMDPETGAFRLEEVPNSGN